MPVQDLEAVTIAAEELGKLKMERGQQAEQQAEQQADERGVWSGLFGEAQCSAAAAAVIWASWCGGGGYGVQMLAQVRVSRPCMGQ